MLFTTNGTLGRTSTATNAYTGKTISLAGKRGSTGIFTANSTDSTLVGDSDPSNPNDAFIYDFTIGGTTALRFVGITWFDLGAGDDILDLTLRPTTVAPLSSAIITILGGDGDDVIWGGGSRTNLGGYAGGPETFYGDVIDLHGQGGDDVIDVGGSFFGMGLPPDHAYGDAFTMHEGSIGGDDILTGSSGSDQLRGDAQYLYGVGGRDVVHGGDGDDTIFGDSVHIHAGGVGGDDTLFGDGGIDFLYGDGYGLYAGTTAGNDTIYGGGEGDVLYGDAKELYTAGGDDILDGGAGNDQLYGDAVDRFEDSSGGADIFVFGPYSGADIIFDFGFGADRIDVSAFGFTSLADLNIVQTAGAAVEVHFDASNYVTVNHYTGQGLTLTASDFIFAQPA